MALHTWSPLPACLSRLGRNSLLALTHGALHGHRRALWTIGGNAIGFIAAIALSMLGIGLLLQASANALRVMK